MMQIANTERVILGFVDEVIKKDVILNKIDKDELKVFVDSDGRIVTNEFKVSMKELHDALK